MPDMDKVDSGRSLKCRLVSRWSLETVSEQQIHRRYSNIVVHIGPVRFGDLGANNEARFIQVQVKVIRTFN